jgi:hypothetical protein
MNPLAQQQPVLNEDEISSLAFRLTFNIWPSEGSPDDRDRERSFKAEKQLLKSRKSKCTRTNDSGARRRNPAARRKHFAGQTPAAMAK